MFRKFLVVIGMLILVPLVLTACGGGAEVVSSGTASGDYISPILQTTVVGSTVGAGVIWGVIALVLGFIGAVVAFFALGNIESRGNSITMAIVSAVVVFVLLGGVTFGGAFAKASYVTVDAGQVGVVLDQGKAVDTLQPGQHWISGFTQKVVLFSTREFTFSTNSDPLNKGSEQYRTWDMEIITRDGVDGSVPFQIVAQIDSAKAVEIYEEFGTLENAITQLLKTPALEEIRNAIRGKDAEEIISEIDLMNEPVQASLTNRTRGNGLTIITFGFRRPDFGAWQDERNAAQVALQTAVKEQNNRQVVEAQQAQAKIIAENNAAMALITSQQQADSAVIAAKGAAEAKKIEADSLAYASLAAAEAEAEGNQLKAESITANLIEYLRWTNWDGAWPTTWLSPDANILIQPK